MVKKKIKELLVTTLAVVLVMPLTFSMKAKAAVPLPDPTVTQDFDAINYSSLPDNWSDIATEIATRADKTNSIYFADQRNGYVDVWDTNISDFYYDTLDLLNGGKCVNFNYPMMKVFYLQGKYIEFSNYCLFDYTHFYKPYFPLTASVFDYARFRESYPEFCANLTDEQIWAWYSDVGYSWAIEVHSTNKQFERALSARNAAIKLGIFEYDTNYTKEQRLQIIKDYLDKNMTQLPKAPSGRDDYLIYKYSYDMVRYNGMNVDKVTYYAALGLNDYTKPMQAPNLDSDKNKVAVAIGAYAGLNLDDINTVIKYGL